MRYAVSDPGVIFSFLFLTPIWRIVKYSELPSTNTYARERLSRGEAKEGDVVQAGHQTTGRGRIEGRTWLDRHGDALLMSVVLRSSIGRHPELVAYIAALAAARAVRDLIQSRDAAFDKSRVQIKWPNDVLLDGKKFCGILSEAVWNGGHLKGIVLGIGLNVRQDSFEGEIATRATSLKIATGVELEIDQVRDAILAELQAAIEAASGDASFRDRALDYLRQELEWMLEIPPFDVELIDGKKQTEIKYCGIAEDGALIAEDANGTQSLVYAGTLLI